MASPELGAKQICPNCSAKFYDLNRRPAHCPKCATEFDPEEAVKSRRGRSRLNTYDDDETPQTTQPEPEGYEDEVDDTPEIDQAIEDEVVESDEEGDAEPGEAASTPKGDGDLGVDFASEDEDDLAGDGDDDDVPFLEDEDDDFADDDIDGLGGDDDDQD